MKRFDLLLGAAVAVLSTATSATIPTSEDEIQEAFHAFISAFDNLDMRRFIASFSEDATAFTPTGNPRRISGRKNIETFFQHVFDDTRKASGRTHPPYMQLQARDLLIQQVEGSAILSFHLEEPDGSIHRRTFVYRHSISGWEIVHLHASNGPPRPRAHAN